MHWSCLRFRSNVEAQLAVHRTNGLDWVSESKLCDQFINSAIGVWIAWLSQFTPQQALSKLSQSRSSLEGERVTQLLIFSHLHQENNCCCCQTQYPPHPLLSIQNTYWCVIVISIQRLLCASFTNAYIKQGCSELMLVTTMPQTARAVAVGMKSRLSLMPKRWNAIISQENDGGTWLFNAEDRAY